MHFKWVTTTNLYKEVDKKYTGCNLKTLLDCALIGICAVIRSNTVVANLCHMNITEGTSFFFYVCFVNFFSKQEASLVPWKLVWDIGSLSHGGLIIAPGQEANGNDFGNFFSIYWIIMVYWVYSLELSWWVMGTYSIQFHDIIRKFP